MKRYSFNRIRVFKLIIGSFLLTYVGIHLFLFETQMGDKFLFIKVNPSNYIAIKVLVFISTAIVGVLGIYVSSFLSHLSRGIELTSHGLMVYPTLAKRIPWSEIKGVNIRTISKRVVLELNIPNLCKYKGRIFGILAKKKKKVIINCQMYEVDYTDLFREIENEISS